MTDTTTTFDFAIGPDRASGIITSAAPIHRGYLQQFVANARMVYFNGVQVPFQVIVTDPTTGKTTEELIPGCATCAGD